MTLPSIDCILLLQLFLLSKFNYFYIKRSRDMLDWINDIILEEAHRYVPFSCFQIFVRLSTYIMFIQMRILLKMKQKPL